jgi:hypothetical protein
MAASPKVSRIVLFKHGVAYLERGGPAEGDFDLSFKQDEMNDVLKSLSVWVAKGDGRVGSISFEAPADPEEALAKRRLILGEGRALLDLVQSLRGRRVAVGEDAQRIEGEVIGVERVEGGDGGERRSLVLRTSAGTLSLRDLASLGEVQLLDDVSQRDLAFVVDRTKAANAGENRNVRVRLQGAVEDLRVAYVVPAPIWRVSYRLVREGDDVLLMAWGIIHNPADEDVEDVDLTLTTGQPVSFEIDLYKPKLVARRRVEEKSRAAAGPESFEPSVAMPPPPPAMMAFGGPPGGAPPAPAPAPAPRAASMGDGMQSSVAAQASGADRGEMFEYRVLSKLSLGRGGSAMVPLLSAKVPTKKERIWRPGPSANPNIALSFQNDTGAVLEEGPAVIYDEDVYAGEAMVPYTTRGTAVKIAFARDLSIAVTLGADLTTRLSGLRLSDLLLYEDLVRENHLTVSVESSHDVETEVVIELPRTHGRSLHQDSAQPFEETGSARRFRVKAAPRAITRLVVIEWWSDFRSTKYEKVSTASLTEWLSRGMLDLGRHSALQEVVTLWAAADDYERQAEASERRATECYARQKRIGEQLGVLRADGPEGALRLKHVRELEIEQAEAARQEQEAKRQRSRAEDIRAEARGLLGKATAPKAPGNTPLA